MSVLFRLPLFREVQAELVWPFLRLIKMHHLLISEGSSSAPCFGSSRFRLPNGHSGLIQTDLGSRMERQVLLIGHLQEEGVCRAGVKENEN